MTKSELEKKPVLRRRILDKFVELLKIYLIIKPLQYAYRNNGHDKKLQSLRELPQNSIGKDISILLDDQKLQLIPKFENHDLKHLILGYGMTSQEEIKMQVYLLGNGNYSIYSILFASTGLLYPSEWNNYKADFRKGKISVPILELDLEECMTEETQTIRSEYNRLKTHDEFIKARLQPELIKSN